MPRRTARAANDRLQHNRVWFMLDQAVCVQHRAAAALPGFLCAAAQLSTKRATLLLLILLLTAQQHSAKDERSKEQLISAVAEAVVSGPVPRAPYTLAACAVFWNEKPYLFEWVVYHYLLGVQHFYLYGACRSFLKSTTTRPHSAQTTQIMTARTNRFWRCSR